MHAIEIRDLWKTFKLTRLGAKTMFLQFCRFAKETGRTTSVDALHGISLTIEKGMKVGVVGRNGSGKTTLMRLMAGIYQPTRGEVIVHGKLASFLALGVGMIQRLTVRENIFLYGAILGLTRRQIRQRFDAILDFAELADYTDAEVRQLSTGMRQRLTLSVAIQVDAEILLMDEILAVGDQEFKNRCHEFFGNRLSAETTMIFASHDLDEIDLFCPYTLWLDKGVVADFGRTEVVLDRYKDAIGYPRQTDSPSAKDAKCEAS